MRCSPHCVLIVWWSCCCLSVFSQEPDDTSLIEYSRDTVMQRLDNIHLILNRINNFMDGEFDTRKIEREVPLIDRTLQDINSSVSLLDQNLEFKNLQLSSVMLGDIRDQLTRWRSGLFRYNNELSNIDAELKVFSRDSSIRRLAGDSLYREIYMEELYELKDKWEQANRSTQGQLGRIKALQLKVSKQYFLTVDLISRVVRMRGQLSDQLFRKEYNYLWERNDDGDKAVSTRDLAFRRLQLEAPMINFFLSHNWRNYAWIAVIGGLFFWWVRSNSRRADREKIPMASPFLSALVVMLNLLPLFELHASTFPVSQLPLLVVLSILFRQQWPHDAFRAWLVIAVLYVFFVITRLVLIQTSARIWLLILNILSVSLGFFSLKKFSNRLTLHLLALIVAWLYVVFNAIAIPANLYGRLSLARIFSNSAVFGAVQVAGLSVFVDCLQGSLRLQAEASKTKTPAKTMATVFGKIADRSLHLFRLFSLIAWFISMGINLNIYDQLRHWFTRLMKEPVHIGSFSFQPGNFLLFFFILFLSNFLQRSIGFVFGVSDENALPEVGKKGSRLAVLRLFLIISGFLLAISASGVPLSKVTLILGALGVGIGLGFQTIVTNLVSGVVLILERSFQIGDFIELNNKKGIVRDIGLRSSKIVTEEGTEITIPNADLASGEVVNWTVRNSHVRIEIPLTIGTGHSFQEIEAIVQEVLTHQPGLSEKNKPHVLLNNASEKSTSVTILAWVSNIGQIQTIKSEVLGLLYQQLTLKGLKIL